jgi:hypothetical protein
MSRSRQAIYDRIRESSRDEVILEEMVRLGFWPREGDIPEDPAADIKRSGELQRELAGLHQQLATLQSEEALRAAIRERRMAVARERRKYTKEKKLWVRAQNAHAWQLRKRTELGYLGDGVSGGLPHTTGDDARLASAGLPVLHTAGELAQAMGIDLGYLRHLAFQRTVSRTHHYRCFTIPKKTGGRRAISAPMPRLKWAQDWVRRTLLAPVPVHPAAHGFVPGRSIVTNAVAHGGGAAVVVNLDLADFFPSVSYPRVKGLFRALGYSEQVATVLGLLCTEAPTTAVEMDGTTWYVQEDSRRLPQGSPASPAITNLICRRLDKRLTAAADRLGFRYTRYADDCTFSAKDAGAPVGKLLGWVRRILADEGFQEHPSKTRVQRPGRRQEVTGLVVNGGEPRVPRATLRRLRALLHQIERDGPEGKRWGDEADVLNAVQGVASFVYMVQPDKGRALLQRVQAIHARWAPGPRGAAARDAEAERARWFPALPEPEPPTEPEPVPPPPDLTLNEMVAAAHAPRANPVRMDRAIEAHRSGMRGRERRPDRAAGTSAPTGARVVAGWLDWCIVILGTWGLEVLLGSAAPARIAMWCWFLSADATFSFGKWRNEIEVRMLNGTQCTPAAAVVRRLPLLLAAAGTKMVSTTLAVAYGDGKTFEPTQEQFKILALAVVVQVLLLLLEFGLLFSPSGRRLGDRLAGTRVVPR